ncbi:RagB/SusD family nutrient uptake outer membrane protein [Pedobacter frigidisoli]|uniref:RagB/SusD family nutrient uptake outer membrane protein n=1 Tax=Pedobacter frigidisoli TaxID=2530455 RepID=UPI00292CA8A6|nr:RagB/SusD family nutrient uptake outer membrane protein [Pedobacter frigidisoli]
MKNYKYRYTICTCLTILFSLSGCKKDLLDTQPLSSISDATFWRTAGDATLALNGVYDSGAGFTGYNFWAATSMVNLDLMAGNGSEKELIPDNFTNGTLNSTYGFVGLYYTQAYNQITRCNNFLANIDRVTMDAGQKAVMIGEVRTIRAYDYFNLALYFGDVPLVQKLLTVEEANSVVRTSKSQVWSFCEAELKGAAAVLPVSVSADRLGHITSAAALAILGRLQLAQKKWADAAATYRSIIDFNYYSIDPRYRELFLNAGETSREIIMSMQYIRDTYNHALLQYLTPETWGGWHQYSPFNELVEAYECKDGKTIGESPLYDKNNPYQNRDPRMDFNIMISDRTSFRGRVYSAKPGTTLPDRLNQYPGVWSGYAIYKFLEDDPAVATTNNTGNNFPLIRYAEVLLGYLESQLEAGNAIDQAMLDATINKVRGRAVVSMPAITTSDPVLLRTIIRRERRVEFAFEGIRYFDCLRWGIIGSENNQQFTGMKLTNDPSNYKDYPVNADGYYIYKKRNFIIGKNELWPIPQSERDLNKNLTQNPGY